MNLRSGLGLSSVPAADSRPGGMIQLAGRRDIAGLRQHIHRLEGRQPGLEQAVGRPAIGLGVPALDAALPWHGLPIGALHEITPGLPGDGSLYDFAAALMRRFAGPAGRMLWCRARQDCHETGLLHGPGLVALGLPVERLLLVEAAKPADLLWAMEEGLRCRQLSVVLGELADLDLTQSRRLQLAAEAHGVTALVLRPDRRRLGPTAALTRWRIAALPMQGNMPAFAATLLRCKGMAGENGQWPLCWDPAARQFCAADKSA